MLALNVKTNLGAWRNFSSLHQSRPIAIVHQVIDAGIHPEDEPDLPAQFAREARPPTQRAHYHLETTSGFAARRGPVPHTAAPPPVLRTTRDTTDRSYARALVGRMYAWRGYRPQNEAERLSSTTTLLARSQDGRAIATISIGVDRSRPLMAESLYPDEIRMLRASGSILCEFTQLAVDQVDHSLDLLASTFHAAYLYARRRFGCTDLLAEVNPRHAAFYRQLLGFRQVGPQRLCPRVGAPALLLWLPLRYAEEQIARLGGTGTDAGVRSLYPRFFAPEQEPEILAALA